MRVLLVCKGDARKRATWSGVPHLIRDGLLAEGCEVVDCNLFDDFLFHWVGAAWNLFHDVKRREFESTILGGWLMARAVRRMSIGCDRVVALTFALDARSIPVPVELVHDWTLGYFWKHWDRAEARVIERMRHASVVKCFYPGSCEYLVGKGVNAQYIGLPFESPPDDVAAIGDGKSHAVIFASPWHLDNLEPCAAWDGFDVIDVIGSSGRGDGRLRFHGYLNKDVPAEREKYWGLLKGARAVIAMGRSWPGGNSLAEAKVCGCKIITRDWPDLRDIV